MSLTSVSVGEFVHDLPRSALLLLSAGRSCERDNGQRDYAYFQPVAAGTTGCADISQKGSVE